MTISEFPVDRSRRPVGTFHAVSVQDAASQERDGQPVYEVRALATSDGRELCEVCFADGAWLLADPERDVVPAWEFDAFPDHPFLAVEYGEDWNGWATPVVHHEVLADALVSLELPHRWDGDLAVVEVEDYEDVLRPREDGLYDLSQAGWTLQRVELS